MVGDVEAQAARCIDAVDTGSLHPIRPRWHHTGEIDLDQGELGEVAGLAYPSAPDVVRAWAMRAACDPDAVATLAPRDVDSALAGAETSVLAYQSGCTAPASVELWTIDGGQHLPALASGFAHEVVKWLRARAR